MRPRLILLLVAACQVTPLPGEDAPLELTTEYGPEVRSFRVVRSTLVRAAPDEESDPLGTVSQGTRVGFLGPMEPGPGCAEWVAIVPRGWLCTSELEPSPEPPAGAELPPLGEEEVVPGLYGRIARGGARVFASLDDARAGRTARRLDAGTVVHGRSEITVAGRKYWLTPSGELIRKSRIRAHRPSDFAGLWIGGKILPIAWTADRKLVPVEDPRARHVARLTPPPPLTAPDERWIDIDLDEQVLVAYEGWQPVYATLISTGSRRWPTPEGIYRIWLKLAETDMDGGSDGEDAYMMAGVPWTAFFDKDLALHGTYWHDRFGRRRSHGCINLAPRDARILYFWSSPGVPPGWSASLGTLEFPGSMVRVRSLAVPQPEFQGYARSVHATREGVR